MIDKTLQTSDWTRRPLTDAQVAYAALDVEVLVQLFALFRQTQPELALGGVPGGGAGPPGAGGAPIRRRCRRSG